MYYQNKSDVISPSMLSHIQPTYQKPDPSSPSPQHQQSLEQTPQGLQHNHSQAPSSSSPFQHSPNHQQRLLNASNASTPTRSKRRNSNSENLFKKIKSQQSPLHTQKQQQQLLHPSATNSVTNSTFNKAISDAELTIHNINLNEYPKFHHPDGGFIQTTPIGNIRTWISDNNVVHKIVEKNSSFDLSKRDNGIDGYKLHLGNNGFDLNSSPSNEIEGYMRNGYSTPSTATTNPSNLSSGTSYYDDGGSGRYHYYNDDDDSEDEDDDYEMS